MIVFLHIMTGCHAKEDAESLVIAGFVRLYCLLNALEKLLRRRRERFECVMIYRSQ